MACSVVLRKITVSIRTLNLSHQEVRMHKRQKLGGVVTADVEVEPDPEGFRIRKIEARKDRLITQFALSYLDTPVREELEIY